MKKKINNKKFTKCYRENLYGSIIILLIMILCPIMVFWYYPNKKINVDKNRLDLTTLDLFDKDNIGQYVYIDIYEKPQLINYDKQYTKQVYVIQQKDKDYIVLLKPSDVDQLEESMQNEQVVRLYGYTKKADNDIRTKSLDFLGKKTERDNLKMNDFNKYLGCLYLHDSKYGELDDNIILFKLLFVFLSIIFIILARWVIIFRKNLCKLNNKELIKLNNEINEENTIYFGEVFLCKSYLVDSMRMKMYNYSDIEKVYISNARVRKIKKDVGYHIHIKTKKDKRKKYINSAMFFETSIEDIDKFIGFFEEKYPNIEIIK